MLIFSHATADGYSCTRAVKCFLETIENKIAGRPVDDTEQAGTLFDVMREKELQEKIEKSFNDNPAFLEKRKLVLASASLETLFEKAYPVRPNVKPTTRCIIHVVNEDLTTRFIKRCKKEGVTVHTGFCSLIERAIMKMMVDKNFKQEKFTISSLHAADNRVFYKNCVDELGVGMGIMDFTYEQQTAETFNNFWAATKKLHTKFKEQHSFIPGLEHEIIERLTGQPAVELLAAEGQAAPTTTMTYYTTTNMRGPHRPVQWSWRTSSAGVPGPADSDAPDTYSLDEHIQYLQRRISSFTAV